MHVTVSMNPLLNGIVKQCILIAQLTNETYVDAVAMLSRIVKATESINEQTGEVLGIVANYLDDVADFVNISLVIIDTAVSKTLHAHAIRCICRWVNLIIHYNCCHDEKVAKSIGNDSYRIL